MHDSKIPYRFGWSSGGGSRKRGWKEERREVKKKEKFSVWGQRSSKALESRRFQGEKNCLGVRGQNEIRD